MRHATVVTAILILLLAPLAADAGELALGGATYKGTTVSIPVVLKGDVGTGVAAMDFTVTYDPAVFEPVGVTAGKAASAADKGVQYNLLEPGRCKVVMMGLNQSVVPSGEVAMLKLRRLSTNGGPTELAIDEPTFSDPAAAAIPSKGTTETIDLTGDVTTPNESETETDPDAETPAEEGSDPSKTPDTTTQPGSTEVAPPGAAVPSAPGDGKVPAGTSPNVLPGTTPVGTLPAMAGDPKDPALAKRLKLMARMGDSSQLPKGIQPGAVGAPLGATPEAAGVVNAQPGTAPGTDETPTGTPGLAAKRPAPGAGALAMNPVGGPAHAAVPAVKGVAPSNSTPSSTKSASGLNPKWVGVGAIVLAMGVLFFLRRRLFS